MNGPPTGEPAIHRSFIPLTAPLFIVQILSLVLTTWYLAALFSFLTSSKHTTALRTGSYTYSQQKGKVPYEIRRRWPERPWIYVTLTILALLLTWNALAACISTGLLFVRDYGQSMNVLRMPFYLKAAPIACGFASDVAQIAYLNFILRLSFRMISRPFTYAIGILCTCILMAHTGLLIYLCVQANDIGSYLVPHARDRLDAVFKSVIPSILKSFSLLRPPFTDTDDLVKSLL